MSLARRLPARAALSLSQSANARAATLPARQLSLAAAPKPSLARCAKAHLVSCYSDWLTRTPQPPPRARRRARCAARTIAVRCGPNRSHVHRDSDFHFCVGFSCTLCRKTATKVIKTPPMAESIAEGTLSKWNKRRLTLCPSFNAVLTIAIRNWGVCGKGRGCGNHRDRQGTFSCPERIRVVLDWLQLDAG